MDNLHIEDSPYCPYPPSVSINKSLPILANDSEPLDFMSYFVDEHLMEMAESEGIVEFFRKYMAGFVISKRESAVSHCGLAHSDSDIDDRLSGFLMCLMLSTTPVVRNESLFADSIARQEIMINDTCYNRSEHAVFTYQGTVECSLHRDLTFRYNDPTIAQYPNCNNVTLDFITLSLEENTITNFAMIDNNFEVDGIVRQTSDSATMNEDELVGRIYAPYGRNTENTEMTGATVFYNNQVVN